MLHLFNRDSTCNPVMLMKFLFKMFRIKMHDEDIGNGRKASSL
jgi:hypothetical protein